jgi:DNA-binding GntR family transcriptional regulator
LLSIPEESFRRLEPYLPKGLVPRQGEDLLARARGQLARLVLMQRLNPGQKVPMDDIAQAIGASRTPVREALRLLETEGLVASLPNRGFVVCRLTPDEATQLYEARRCVEVFTAPLAFERRNRTFLAELRALHRMYGQVLAGPHDRRRLGMLVDKAFHLRIAEQAANRQLAAMLANLFDRLILTRPMDGTPVPRMALAVSEHQAIVEAFQGNAARDAIEAVRTNIDKGGAAVVSQLRSVEGFSLAL